MLQRAAREPTGLLPRAFAVGIESGRSLILPGSYGINERQRR